ncbi:MAG: YjbQ family protein [Candidatus Omnitrophica bacterium]|nr:YjbQ family protein [Candidatus Omnitrophota bacterium]
MKIENHKIELRTRGFCDIHDLTPEAHRKIETSKVKNGQVTFFVVGSTAGITTVEYEPGLIKDLKVVFEKLAPENGRYYHEDTWHDGNGFSHVRASLLKPSLSVPLVNGEMTLGTWQQVILIDFDNTPRSRQVVLQIMGE